MNGKWIFKEFDKFIDEENRIVGGKFTDDLVDVAGHIINKDAMVKAFKEWVENWGNIKEMHLGPIGRVVVSMASGEAHQKGWNYLFAQILDESAWSKVVNGLYRGFSVGILAHDGKLVSVKDVPESKFAGLPESIVKSIKRVGRVFEITDLTLLEVSIVDVPENPRAVFAKGLSVGDGVQDLPSIFDGAESIAKSIQEAKGDVGVSNKIVLDVNAGRGLSVLSGGDASYSSGGTKTWVASSGGIEIRKGVDEVDNKIEKEAIANDVAVEKSSDESAIAEEVAEEPVVESEAVEKSTDAEYVYAEVAARSLEKSIEVYDAMVRLEKSVSDLADKVSAILEFSEEKSVDVDGIVEKMVAAVGVQRKSAVNSGGDSEKNPQVDIKEISDDALLKYISTGMVAKYKGV